jgi:hypothetical protein
MEMSSYLYPSPKQADLLMHNRQVTHDLLRDAAPLSGCARCVGIGSPSPQHTNESSAV